MIHGSFLIIITTMKTITPIKISRNGIQIGENTHNQLQAILLSSFRTIKTMVNNPQKPIPDDDEFDILRLQISWLNELKRQVQTSSKLAYFSRPGGRVTKG